MSLWERIKAATAYVLNLYDGAQYSSARRWVQEEVQSARWDIDQPTRRELVRLSRNCEKNVAIVNKLADVFEQYTVGQGLVVQPASSDEAWNLEAANAWATWTEFPDLTSRQEFGTTLSLMSRAWFVDGEVFVLLVRGDSGRPRVQVIESHLVETPPKLAQNANVVDGIQLDTNGRPEGYWIAAEDSKRNRTYTLTPADSVIHIVEPGRAGQLRGIPFITPVLNTLRDLDLLETLEMQAAKAAASVTNVFKLKGSLNDVESFRKSMASGTKVLSTGASISTSVEKHFKDVTGAAPVVLTQDDSFEQFKSDRPSVVTREYWRKLEEKVCVGVGIPYVVVFPDSMQGTVYRGALDMAASFFRIRSSVLQAACKRIYRHVMAYSKVVDIKAKTPADWWRCSVGAPRAVNVDVGRNSRALIEEIGSGAKTFATAYAELGLDYRAELRQKAVEAKYIRDLATKFEVDPSEVSNIQVDKPERIQTSSEGNTPEPELVEGDKVKEEQDGKVA